MVSASGPPLPAPTLPVNTLLESAVTAPPAAVEMSTAAPAPLPTLIASTPAPWLNSTRLAPRSATRPPGAAPKLLASRVLASMVRTPAWIKTLPPGPGTPWLATLKVEPPAIATEPKFLTVRVLAARGSTGTSPTPAALATWIVPPGAVSVPLVIDTGPPTSPSMPATGPRVRH